MTILANANDYIHSIGKIESDPDFFGDPAGDHLAACHASYVDMLKMHNIASWRSYRYWILITTDGIFMNENPYLFASNNLTSWTEIIQVDDQGLLDGEGSSDGSLVYDSDLNSMVLYFKRENPGQQKGIFRRTYNSSGELSAATLVISAATLGGMSPGIVRKLSDGNYHAWYIKPDGPTDPVGNNQIYYRSLGADGLTPGAEQACTVDVIQDGYSGFYPWHIEARENLYIPGRVDFVIACKVAGGDVYAGMVLVHAQGSFSTPTVITTPLAPDLLLAPAGAEVGLYRSSFALDRSGSDLLITLAYDRFGGADPDFDRIAIINGVLQTNPGFPGITGLTTGGAISGLTTGGAITGME